jgi:molybdopterin converting factor small subunit
VEVKVHFYSYCKEVTGCATTVETLAEARTIGDLLGVLFQRFPKLAALQKSLLVAVGVEYQGRDYVLRPGDEVSLFPPVQGG